MRIAVVCSDLGIRIPGAKGASLHLSAITDALQRLDNEVTLVAVAGSGQPPPGHHLLLPHPGRAEGLRREVRKLRFVAQLPSVALDHIARFAPDVVYERLSLFGAAGRSLAARLGVPHVVEVNALLADEDAAWRGLRLRRLARSREQNVLGHADRVVAVSDELAATIRLRTGRPVDVLPNGVEAALFANLPSRDLARHRFGLPPEASVIGFTGALRPWHGVELAIEALGEIPNAVLAIAGDGPIRAELEERARSRGLSEGIRWMGALAHHDVPAFLAALDVAVAPYPDLPGFFYSPLKVYEYLAAGVPVVASGIGQISDLVGPWGRLVTAGSTKDLAAAIRATLDDPAAHTRAAEARAWTLANHSWDKRAERLTLILTEVAGALAR